jgi:nicotinamide mononucleotide adenylyltransferase
MIVDYKGRVVGQHLYGSGSSYVAGTVDIDALRDFRTRAQWDNWMKDLRTEMYQLVYEQPIYPRNLYLERAPYRHAEFRQEVIEKQVELMLARDIWRRPRSGPGVNAKSERKDAV